MSEEFKIYAIAGLTVVALIICIVLLSNNKKSSIKKNIDDLTVRFNTIKSTPLAFKLNKAQVMAKRSDEASSDVKEYYKKYGQKPPKELWLTMHYFVMWTPVEEYPESFNKSLKTFPKLGLFSPE